MNYGFTVKQCILDGELVWVAESTDLDGCVGQGISIDEAIEELKTNEETWLSVAEEYGFAIPAPSVEHEQNDYSGKLSLRLGKRIHAETAKRAKEDGLSINQYITNAVVTYNTRRSVESLAIELLREAEITQSNLIRKPYRFSMNYNDPIHNSNYKFKSRS